VCRLLPIDHRVAVGAEALPRSVWLEGRLDESPPAIQLAGVLRMIVCDATSGRRRRDGVTNTVVAPR
jgi:hypothetical protein